MEFQKNQFWKMKPTKIAGNKVLSKNDPFTLSKKFLNKIQFEEKPMTPERRYEEQKNQRHFINGNRFPK